MEFIIEVERGNRLMGNRFFQIINLKSFFAYIIITLLSFLMLVYIMELWDVDLNVPLVYLGDGLSAGMLVKSVIDNGWFLENQYLGAPIGANLYDYPLSDGFHFLLMKLIALFHPDYAFVMNFYLILTFPFTAIVSFFVFRQFNISYIPAFVGSMLYTFLPYHFFRWAGGHIFLAAYYTVPLVVMVFLWMFCEKNFLFFYNEDKGKYKFELFSFKSMVSIIACLLISSSGIYYAFFTCFFLAVQGLAISIFRKRFIPIVVAGFLISTVCIGVFANVVPNIIYTHYNGENSEVGKRSPLEADLYGLKISQLLLPISGHRISFLKELKEKYNSSFPLVNENDNASLGILGSTGFLISLYIFLFRREQKNDIKQNLSFLNVCSILFASIGGLSTLFSILISPQIRGYNRISVFIAFFSIFILVLVFNDFKKKFISNRALKIVFNTFLIIICLVGILDQTNKNFFLPYEILEKEYKNDKEFIRKIEVSLPKGAMIFQMPYVSFPEQPPVNQMGGYDLAKGYLHSTNLKWNFGATTGRESDAWQKNTINKTLDEMIETLSLAGFKGIYIDRNGYADKGIEIEGKLSSILKTKPLISENQRLSFFNMETYNKEVENKYTKNELNLKRDNALHPVLLTWKNGFYGLEQNESGSWRWSQDKSSMIINNYSSKERIVTIEMSFQTGYEQLSSLFIETPTFKEELKVNNKEKKYIKTIRIPSGSYIIKFTSNAEKVNVPDESRNLFFRVNNFKIDYK